MKNILFLSMLSFMLAGCAERPRELSPQESKEGITRVQKVINLVRQSPFAHSKRGAELTSTLHKFLNESRVKFSDSIHLRCLCRKEFGGQAILYIGVIRSRQGLVWQDSEALARRIYHEVLHAIIGSSEDSKQEECDAFCAGAEAVAAVEKRTCEYPVRKDGQIVWEWVKDKYPDTPSDKNYIPLEYTFSELAEKTGIPKE
jgi:hypothetical protein